MEWGNNIYFERNYGKLYERIEYGVAENYCLKTENGEIVYHFIKRRIPNFLWEGKEAYDIRTPYGYGGPIILKCIDKKKIISDFNYSFSNYCANNNIISEFVRFHPLVGNATEFSSIYNIQFNRKTVVTKLDSGGESIKTEFTKSCKKNIKRALNKGIDYRIEEYPSEIDKFVKIYYSTMKRKEANEYYYFDEKYFIDIIKYFRNQLIAVYVLYEGIEIAAGIFFASGPIVDIHLSGTLDEYLYLSPAYVLRYAIVLWAAEHGYKYIHHGGGKTVNDNDSLYCFKRQFGQAMTGDFYIAEKKRNQEAYMELATQFMMNENINDFIRRCHEEDFNNR